MMHSIQLLSTSIDSDETAQEILLQMGRQLARQ
jgi:hypothetical protein